MSGTAPSGSAPGGGHDTGHGQTPLDSNQHGQSRNIIDETRDNNARGPATAADRDVGGTIDAANKSGAHLSSRVDDLLNRKSASTAAASTATDEGFRVGDEEGADLHGLASRKQP